jgi:hypothetical protein
MLIKRARLTVNRVILFQNGRDIENGIVLFRRMSNCKFRKILRIVE